VHASPSFVQFDLGNPAGERPDGLHPPPSRKRPAYVVRGHLGIIGELTGARITELTFSGGAAKGTLWPQIIADVLGLPVSVPRGDREQRTGRRAVRGQGASGSTPA